MTEEEMELRRMSIIVQRNATAADLEAAQDRYAARLLHVPGHTDEYRCTRVRLDQTRRIVLDLALEHDLAPLPSPVSGMKPRGLAAVPLERRREIARQGGFASPGFRGMDPERRREVVARGGYAIHAAGVAHHWTPEEAAAAGRKGGRAPRRTRRKEAS